MRIESRIIRKSFTSDVEIMIEQIVYLAKIDRKDIEECIQYKLERQMKRIEEEESYVLQEAEE